MYILKAEASRITVTRGSPAVLWEMTLRDMHRRILSHSGKFIREKKRVHSPKGREQASGCSKSSLSLDIFLLALENYSISFPDLPGDVFGPPLSNPFLASSKLLCPYPI